jgi:phosphoglucosamine mutase
MISASHNPFEDNGIKFFSSDGMKLPDAWRARSRPRSAQPMTPPPPRPTARPSACTTSEGRYLEFCKGTFPKQRSLRGLKLVVDCAHGANYRIGPRVFQELGAEVVAIGDRPNGTNINDGFGATSPARCRKPVIEHKADFGIAFDGDGDRLAMATTTAASSTATSCSTRS